MVQDFGNQVGSWPWISSDHNASVLGNLAKVGKTYDEAEPAKVPGKLSSFSIMASTLTKEEESTIRKPENGVRLTAKGEKIRSEIITISKKKEIFVTPIFFA